MDTLKHALLALAACSALAGCTTLAPYERETLSTTRMRLDGNAEETSLVQTRLRTREEGHLGGSPGGGGGGCGCN